MKKFIAGFLVGALLFSFIGVFAYNIYENPYKIMVNGVEKQIQGYNVDDYSYFKLRDIADAVGGFDVDFQNDTIQISNDNDIVVSFPTKIPSPTSVPINSIDNKYALDNVQTKEIDSISFYDEINILPSYGKYFNIATEDYETNGKGMLNISYPYNEKNFNEYCVLLEKLHYRRLQQDEIDKVVYKLGYFRVELKKIASKLYISAYRDNIQMIKCDYMVNTKPIVGNSFKWLTKEDIENVEWISVQELKENYNFKFYRNVYSDGTKDSYGIYDNVAHGGNLLVEFTDWPYLSVSEIYFECNSIFVYIDPSGEIHFSKSDLKKAGVFSIIY